MLWYHKVTLSPCKVYEFTMHTHLIINSVLKLRTGLKEATGPGCRVLNHDDHQTQLHMNMSQLVDMIFLQQMQSLVEDHD